VCGRSSLRKKSVSHQEPKSHDLRHRDNKIDVSEPTDIHGHTAPAIVSHCGDNLAPVVGAP